MILKDERPKTPLSEETLQKVNQALQLYEAADARAQFTMQVMMIFHLTPDAAIEKVQEIINFKKALIEALEKIRQKTIDGRTQKPVEELPQKIRYPAMMILASPFGAVTLDDLAAGLGDDVENPRKTASSYMSSLATALAELEPDEDGKKISLTGRKNYWMVKIDRSSEGDS